MEYVQIITWPVEIYVNVFKVFVSGLTQTTGFPFALFSPNLTQTLCERKGSF